MRIGFTRLSAAFGMAMLTATQTPNASASQAVVADYWRFTAHVRTVRGARFHLTAAFYRQPLVRASRKDRFKRERSRWEAPAMWSVTYALVGEDDGTGFNGTVVERETAGFAGAAADGSIAVDGERLAESNRGIALSLNDRRGSLVLSATPLKREVRPSPGEIDLTRLRVTATMTIDGRRDRATGSAWYERLDRTGARERAVERYEVQLDDGRDVLLEALRPTPPTAFARRTLREFVISRDGSLRRLARMPSSGGPHGALVSWRSLHTGIEYPILWGVTIPSETLQISLEPIIEDQEWNTAGRGRPFWDGAVDVYDVTPGSPGARLGAGYVLQTP